MGLNCIWTVSSEITRSANIIQSIYVWNSRILIFHVIIFSIANEIINGEWKLWNNKQWHKSLSDETWAQWRCLVWWIFLWTSPFMKPNLYKNWFFISFFIVPYCISFLSSTLYNQKSVCKIKQHSDVNDKISVFLRIYFSKAMVWSNNI